MADRLTKEQRSLNMSHVKGKNTKIEVLVRSYLFREGFRFRKNDKRLPGHPDVVLPKYKTVIFVNGCFWHQHPGCKKATIPETNHDFWAKKLESNVVNDKLIRDALEKMGWKVITVWECELKKHFSDVMTRIVHILRYKRVMGTTGKCPHGRPEREAELKR